MNEKDRERLEEIIGIISDKKSDGYLALEANVTLLRVIARDALAHVPYMGAPMAIASATSSSFLAGYLFAIDEDLQLMSADDELFGDIEDFLGISEEE